MEFVDFGKGKNKMERKVRTERELREKRRNEGSVMLFFPPRVSSNLYIYKYYYYLFIYFLFFSLLNETVRFNSTTKSAET